MDENFGQSYMDECDDWRARRNEVKQERAAAAFRGRDYERKYNELYKLWRQVAIRLGSPDNEDVLKFFDEYRQEHEQIDERLAQQHSLLWDVYNIAMSAGDIGDDEAIEEIKAKLENSKILPANFTEELTIIDREVVNHARMLHEINIDLERVLNDIRAELVIFMSDDIIEAIRELKQTNATLEANLQEAINKLAAHAMSQGKSK